MSVKPPQNLTGWDQWCAPHDMFLCNFVCKISLQVLTSLPKPPGKSRGQSSPPASPTPLETCEACHEPVPLTRLLLATCQNGHTWSRCGLTLCLATDARCSSCIQCGAIVNNTLTINVAAGTFSRIQTVVLWWLEFSLKFYLWILNFTF